MRISDWSSDVCSSDLWPQRSDNWISVANAIVGLATGHTAVAFTNPNMVPPQNIRTTVNSRGARTTTYMIPEEHLPLVLPFKYLGVDQKTLIELDNVLKPYELGRAHD